jgi:hypothetical protein
MIETTIKLTQDEIRLMGNIMVSVHLGFEIRDPDEKAFAKKIWDEMRRAL